MESWLWWPLPMSCNNWQPLSPPCPASSISLLQHLVVFLLTQTLKKKKCGCRHISFQTQQLDVEDEGGVGRDDARVAFRSVGKVRGAGQLGPLADAHLQRRRRSVGVWPALQSSHFSHNNHYYEVIPDEFSVCEAPPTCTMPSSQPRITSCLPILKRNGLPLSRDESNMWPLTSEPVGHNQIRQIPNSSPGQNPREFTRKRCQRTRAERECVRVHAS